MTTSLRTLDEWLAWQLAQHAREIELGLDRVRAVWERLGAPSPACSVISVGGTNGKGSTVAFLDAMLAAGGHRVGTFTSPHLLRYNERVRVRGVEAEDAQLVAAFARIEKARESIPLTYFEFGTLAALLIFADSDLDVAVLEVGLGGRLDAVNLIDADAAIVTTVDLDHQDWLGNDRELIAREKAGIFRSGRVAIIGEADPPQALLAHAAKIGARVCACGRDYRVTRTADGWVWENEAVRLQLPLPGLSAPCQIANAGAAIAALYGLRGRVAWHAEAIATGILEARVAGRLQRFTGRPELIVDVAHNPQAARMLAQWLAENPCAGRTIAVFGVLADKDVDGIVVPLAPYIGPWHLAGLDAVSPRGLASSALAAIMNGRKDIDVVAAYDNVEQALQATIDSARSDDRILAFGSFFVAAAALAAQHPAPLH